MSCVSTAEKCDGKYFMYKYTILCGSEKWKVKMAEAGADEDHWRRTEFRLKVISQM